MKKLLALIIISLCFISNNYAQNWKSYNSAEGKFTVLIPTEPTQQNDSSRTYPKYSVKMSISKDSTDLFIIGWVDYEAAYTFDEQKELEANRDNFIKAIGGELIATKNIEFKGYKGLEFSTKTGVMFWTSKVFMVGRRPYQLLAGSSTGKASVNENKFYNSFSIKKD